ncbi:hypothetical protein JOC95_000151 [Bacillus tianshenii]|uniref:Uncharacterized protein n=1 Tax=Sutcliffiella tianshenii TaxID=1463404 RepID=A0ABS2NUK4_9BACI|nr:hypothetical protein [Bacillus tianshenii]
MVFGVRPQAAGGFLGDEFVAGGWVLFRLFWRGRFAWRAGSEALGALWLDGVALFCGFCANLVE